jgi:hypothetical protein
VLSWQVFGAGNVTNLADFESTPSLLNDGAALSLRFYSGVRHFSVLHGRYTTDTITDPREIQRLKLLGISVYTGPPKFPLSMTAVPPITGLPVTTYSRRLSESADAELPPESGAADDASADGAYEDDGDVGAAPQPSAWSSITSEALTTVLGITLGLLGALFTYVRW